MLKTQIINAKNVLDAHICQILNIEVANYIGLVFFRWNYCKSRINPNSFNIIKQSVQNTATV